MTRSGVCNRFAAAVAGLAVLFTSLAAPAAPAHPLLAPGKLDAYMAQVRSISPQIDLAESVRAVKETLQEGPQSVERVMLFKPYGEGRPPAYFVVPDRTVERFYTSGLLFCFEGAAGRVDSVFVLSPTGAVLPLPLPTGQTRDCLALLETPAARLIPLVPLSTMV